MRSKLEIACATIVLALSGAALLTCLAVVRYLLKLEGYLP